MGLNYAQQRYDLIGDMNERTVFQKVISYADAKSYINNNYIHGNSAGGYITRAQDAKHLKNVAQIFDGLRLDYLAKSNEFKRDAEFVYVLRFKTKNTVPINLPEGSDPYPFTNNGFTSGINGTFGVPELKVSGGLEFSEAAIYKIDRNGKETVVSVMKEVSAENFRFVKIE